MRRLLALILLIGAGCGSPETPLPPAPETVLFATPEDGSVACYRIPALEQIPGMLFAAIDERVPSCADLRGNRDINILLRRSKDGGRTWGPTERVIDLPEGVSVSDPSFIVDQERGRVFLLANLMDHDIAPDTYRFVVTHSNDAGHTWSPLRDITDEVTPSAWANDFMFVTSGHGTQAADGTLLHTVVNLQRGTFVLMSPDRGETWSLAPTPVAPADESKIVVLPDGAWMVNARVSNAGHRWVHLSTDEGLTWSSRPDSALVDPAVNASLIRMGNNLVFVNANHPNERQNLSWRVSADDGTTWSAATPIHEGSAAYVSAIALRDGSLAVFYERADYTENVFAVVRREN
jgi:sialidase-1